MKHKTTLLRAGILLTSLFLLGSCGQKKPRQASSVGFYFDTFVTITAYDASQALLDEALAECAPYEARLSKTVQGSDVWNVNHSQGQPVTVGEDCRRVLACASAVSEAAQGAFDVSIAPVAALWDFQSETPALPDDDSIAAALPLVDYRAIRLDGDDVTLPAGHSIDLGGIAKGYISDQVAGFLRQAGVQHALLNFGGNVVAVGGKPDGSPWTVGIQDPNGPQGASITTVDVTDGAVVTSGVYERGFDRGGVRYHHILNPRTGWPVQNELASVTIVADSAMLADALATACMVLGYEEALRLLQDFPVQAIFVTRDGEVRPASPDSAQ